MVPSKQHALFLEEAHHAIRSPLFPDLLLPLSVFVKGQEGWWRWPHGLYSPGFVSLPWICPWGSLRRLESKKKVMICLPTGFLPRTQLSHCLCCLCCFVLCPLNLHPTSPTTSAFWGFSCPAHSFRLLSTNSFLQLLVFRLSPSSNLFDSPGNIF